MRAALWAAEVDARLGEHRRLKSDSHRRRSGGAAGQRPARPALHWRGNIMQTSRARARIMRARARTGLRMRKSKNVGSRTKKPAEQQLDA
ncbi:hypothetical protein, partial [Halomonas sp. AOP42-D1-22]|uniref:hypothetical protein n=1 Tax=Halomonas sp. AOP42-D1-22 TaxID=3457667 RepID=UPI004034D276